MKVATPKQWDTSVAARVAGEDIACGDFVAAMNEVVELPSFLWNCSSISLTPDDAVRIRVMAHDAGQPYKVIGVCLPFIYVKTHWGSVAILDTRQRQLVRLDQQCARSVWKKLKSAAKKNQL